ncbi:MAG: hypothetical protein COS14_02775 [Bacteroidetes bacterium CG02_land_8_20_14_3_00_31_25]|nr:helix-turn-helix transcriptional regulator [Bacteroidota bacterium]PIV62120.1 MAG: hypothetical protein COS14_02775 [Bacteroidetes bacterium CG02_land_8_20_14_3_00_31_25]PIY02987.1 MAG: hypothetical protein COZ21_11320 [Bacteroidetes bacterium CG_4_10_14_3_um_filter_31_20]
MEAKKKETKVYKSKILNDFFTINDTKAYKRTEKNMLLALRILKAMQTKEWNRIKFAEEMGVHPSVVTKWLSGTHHFTTETLFDIEEKLNICIINVVEPQQIETIVTYQIQVSQQCQPVLPQTMNYFNSDFKNILYQQNYQYGKR